MNIRDVRCIGAVVSASSDETNIYISFGCRFNTTVFLFDNKFLVFELHERK